MWDDETKRSKIVVVCFLVQKVHVVVCRALALNKRRRTPHTFEQSGKPIAGWEAETYDKNYGSNSLFFFGDGFQKFWKCLFIAGARYKYCSVLG